MSDFYADRHRFRFEYDGKTYIVACYRAVSVQFYDALFEVPRNVRTELERIVIEKVSKEEGRWSFPKEAYAIADAYCAENFV